MKPVIVDFASWEKSVPEALDAANARGTLSDAARVIVKPNLVNADPPPITTPVACVETIVEYVRAASRAEVVIAEGPGDPSVTAAEVFDRLGYSDLSRRLDVPLLDLNEAETVELEDARCTVFRRFHLPRIALESVIISVPVLKVHSLAEITGTLKNMMGFAPPRHYRRGGSWLKSAFHARMHEAILDLNRYRSPDISLVDATIGMPEFHLGGRHCDPPIGKLVAGIDPRAVDRICARLLGLDWKTIPHLADRP